MEGGAPVTSHVPIQLDHFTAAVLLGTLSLGITVQVSKFIIIYVYSIPVFCTYMHLVAAT